MLRPESELRFEVGDSKNVTVTVLEGDAEVFGAPLARNSPLEFSRGKYAIYSWKGAQVSLDGCESSYVSRDTTMLEAMNVHAVLDAKRKRAVADPAKELQGPRIMVVGPTDSGKSSLCRILCGYASRSATKTKPLFIDLDVGQSALGVAGTMSAGSISPATISPIEGIDAGAANPISYFYGHASPGDNPEAYKAIVKLLGDSAAKRFKEDDENRCGGMIINTCGWVDGLGLELLKYSISALFVDAVVVVGHDRLFADLERSRDSTGCFDKSTTIVKVTRSGGVVTRHTGYRRVDRSLGIKKYFYGGAGGKVLSPAQTVLKFSEFELREIVGEGKADMDDAILPVGFESTLDPVRAEPVAMTPSLVGAILAVSHAEKEEDLLSTNVSGIVHVTAINVDEGTMTVLAPCAGPLPGKFLLMGSITWAEHA